MGYYTNFMNLMRKYAVLAKIIQLFKIYILWMKLFICATFWLFNFNILQKQLTLAPAGICSRESRFTKGGLGRQVSEQEVVGQSLGRPEKFSKFSKSMKIFNIQVKFQCLNFIDVFAKIGAKIEKNLGICICSGSEPPKLAK